MANNKDFKIRNDLIYSGSFLETVKAPSSSENGYYIASAIYDGVSYDASSQDATTGVAFKSDGTKMYLVGSTDNTVYQYSLATAWDVGTASYDSISENFTSNDADVTGLSFKPDGTKIYIVGTQTGGVYEYALDPAWDITSASLNRGQTISSQDSNPREITFKPDGTKMYMLGNANDRVYQYSLATPWDLNTLSYDSISFSVTSQESGPVGFEFNPTGTKMFVVGTSAATVFEYDLATAWDVSTATYNSVSFSISGQGSFFNGLAFNDDGKKMYALNSGNETVYQYSTVENIKTLDLQNGGVFELNADADATINLSNPATSGTGSSATLLLTGGAATPALLSAIAYTGNSYDYSGTASGFYNVHIARNGEHIYLGQTGGTIYQFDLSTPNDVSTATYNTKSFNASAQTTFIRDIAVGDNGTKLYVGDGNSPYNVFQYTLSTPYDISTATYASKTYSLASQDANYRDIFFKPDGTKMYHFGASNNRIYQHALSTPWDISTASYESKSLLTSSQSGTSNNFVIAPDGTRVIVMSYAPSNLGLFQYTMSTPWDISTATYDSVSYNGYSDQTGFGNTEYGLTISEDGANIYINDQGDTTIFQYTVAEGPAITYDSTIQWSGGTAPTSPSYGETDVIVFNTTDGGTTYTASLSIDGAK